MLASCYSYYLLLSLITPVSATIHMGCSFSPYRLAADDAVRLVCNFYLEFSCVSAFVLNLWWEPLWIELSLSSIFLVRRLMNLLGLCLIDIELNPDSFLGVWTLMNDFNTNFDFMGCFSYTSSYSKSWFAWTYKYGDWNFFSKWFDLMALYRLSVWLGVTVFSPLVTDCFHLLWLFI